MKVLFIGASKRWEGRTYREYPYGVGILATITHLAGHEVHILDMASDLRDYMNVVKDFQPDVVAISFMSPSVKIASTVIKDISKNSDCKIVAGGIHSTLYPESILEYGANVVMIGEGEPTILDVLKALDSSKNNIEKELEKIPNLVFKSKSNEIKYTKKVAQHVNLDELPIMNRDLFDLNLYAHHTILTSRCCPYGCNFCCSWAPGGKVGRVMSSDRILQELEWLTNKYGKLTLYWGDEIFFWTREARMNFCKILKEKKLPIEFIAQLRADLIDKELIEALADVGCIKVCIGAESGSDQLLKTANKKITASQIEKAISTCVSVGVSCKTWWMVGLPGGDKKEQLKALDVIEKSMPNEVAVHQFVPLPGSKFWNNAKEYGINLLEESEFENLTYYSDPTKLKYDYLSGEELLEILKTYENRLSSLGYVPTDKATKDSKHVFTTPFQKTTFNV